MDNGTLALILLLCQERNVSGSIDEQKRERRECYERSQTCLEHYKKTSKNFIDKCIEEACEDSAAQWATRQGMRTRKDATQPYFKKYWK